MNLFLKSHFGGLLKGNTSDLILASSPAKIRILSQCIFFTYLLFFRAAFLLIMTSLLTGSVAFAGFVIAAETYRSYKEKVQTHNIRN